MVIVQHVHNENRGILYLVRTVKRRRLLRTECVFMDHRVYTRLEDIPLRGGRIILLAPLSITEEEYDFQERLEKAQDRGEHPILRWK